MITNNFYFTTDPQISNKLGELIMKVNELAPALNGIKEQLTKVAVEINTQVATLTAQIEALGDVPSEAVDALAALSGIAQTLDDLNADIVPVEPAPITE